MKIVLISRSWPSNERSGVTLAAREHVQLLSEAGHQVFIVGAYKEVLNEEVPASGRFHVPASGSGALYAPARLDSRLLADILHECSPDVVLVEAWQTALTEGAIDVASQLGVPVVMLSHGISVHPYTQRLPDLLRAIGWFWYRACILPRRLKKLSILAVLDVISDSPRFYDRVLAQRFNIPVQSYTNAPANWRRGSLLPDGRKRQVLVIGYFSSVKNQITAVQVLSRLPGGISMCFVGKRAGSYYAECVALVNKLGLGDRVRFLEDGECDLSEEIASSLVVLSTSRTEVLPLTLLEAMASGTPFVATPVGSVPSLPGGLLACDEDSLAESVSKLVSQPELWQSCARDGISGYESHHTRANVGIALDRILQSIDPPVCAC